MAVALARTIRDGEVVAQGVDSLLASLAILRARATHAPSLTWITVAGGVNPAPGTLPESSASPAWLQGTRAILGNPEFYRLAMRGGMDRMFLGAAQIDQHLRLNLTVIGDRDRPRVRLPGGGGQVRAGLRSAHGAATPKPAAARSTSASCRQPPTICRPIGRPDSVQPQGTEIAGCGLRLKAKVGTIMSRWSRIWRPAISAGIGEPSGDAGIAAVGRTTRS